MKRIALLVFILITAFCSSYSQKEAYNWMCGDTFGLNFNTPDLYPVIMEKPIQDSTFRLKHHYYTTSYSYPAIATLSEKNGSYLLTSYGGIDIWNKNNELIHTVHSTNIDTSFFYFDYREYRNYIIKMPGENNYYYNIFTGIERVDSAWTDVDYVNRSYHTSNSPCYHIIDMNMNGGAGGLKKSDIFFQHRESEIVPISHSNGKDIWIVTFPADTDYVYSYLLSENGLDTVNSVVSKRPKTIYVDYLWDNQNIKASPRGDRIAFPGDDSVGYLLLGFDNSTGKITDTLTRLSDVKTQLINSIEFSPDGSKIYKIGYQASDSGRILLVQYDLKDNAKAVILDTLNRKLGYLYYYYMHHNSNLIQLGPGNRIYVLDHEKESDANRASLTSIISVIDKPNLAGLACNYKKNILRKEGNYYKDSLYYYDWKLSYLNHLIKFPNIFTSIFSFEITCSGTSQVCEGDTIYLSSVLSKTPDSVTYKWSGPNGFSSDEQNPVISNAKPEMSGMYVVSFIAAGGYSGSDSVLVTVNSNPAIAIEGNPTICLGDSSKLSINAGGYKNNKYLWSTGDTTAFVFAKEPGIYSVTATNEFGCSSSDSFRLEVYDEPVVEIKGEKEICRGNPVTLTAESSMEIYKYTWSTGESAKSITAAKPGRYEVIVETINGCRDTASVDIIEMPRAEIEIEGLPCAKDKPVLKAKPEGDYRYLWSTGEKTKDITAPVPGLYMVDVTSPNGCRDTAKIFINPEPVVSIEGSHSLCKGEEEILRTDKEFYSYLWNTGETTREIKISKPGLYSVTVKDSSGCSTDASFDVTGTEVDLSGIENIDFGRICSGETSEKEITIKNEGTDSVDISEIKLQNGSTVFTSPSIKRGSGGVSSGSSLTVVFRFSPRQVGIYKDTVLITTDYPCQRTLVLEIKGTAYARTLIWLPDTTVNINDNISIPLKAEITCGNALPADVSYEADIRYDATALLPDKEQETGVTDKGIMSGNRVFSITGTGTETKLIKGRVILSMKDTTALRIESIKWNNSLVETETNDGSLVIRGLCQQNISKVKSLDRLVMSIMPNPGSDKAVISISGGSKGRVVLNIYNIQGARVDSREIMKSGHQAELSLDLKDYTQGIYELVVQSGSERLVEKMVISK